MRYPSLIRAPQGRATYALVAIWLVVAAVGLALGGLGFNALKGLVDGGPGRGTIATVSAVHEQDDDDSSAWPGGVPYGTADRQLRDATVVAPQQVPDGAPLPGPAPAARVAKQGQYKPFVPTSVRLPSGHLASIEPVGVHSDGALQIPQNPDRVGWWTGGAEAGEPFGTTVLAGHVDSAQFGVGFLAEILRMRPGQELKLANGHYGQRYLVQTVRKVPKAKLAAGTTLFDQDLSHRLVMITCGGPFDRKTHRYRDNVVLTASPVS